MPLGPRTYMKKLVADDAVIIPANASGICSSLKRTLKLSLLDWLDISPVLFEVFFFIEYNFTYSRSAFLNLPTL